MDRDMELALVERWRAGDAPAFDLIYDAFNTRLFTFLYRMARSRDVAEDLTEETWLRFISAAKDLDADTRLTPWLFTVARNLYFSHCRSRAREQAYTGDLIFLWPDGLSSSSPFDAACAKEAEDSLEFAIASLPLLYREVLLLTAVEGLSPAQAARVCGVSPEALRQRLSRARHLLARRWPKPAIRLEKTAKQGVGDYDTA
jgi:RNA polymerase sigma-70 factor, ECF subfamily